MDRFNSMEIAILMPLGNGAKVLSMANIKERNYVIYEKITPVKVGTCIPLAKLFKHADEGKAAAHLP